MIPSSSHIRLSTICRAFYRRTLSGSVASAANIDVSKLMVKIIAVPHEKVEKEKLVFGHVFTDHMLEVDWDSQGGWKEPTIQPYHDFVLSPAAGALHYGLQCFEGMKAYIGVDNKIRMFRPKCNMERLNKSMARLSLPSFDGDQFLKCIIELLKLDRAWFPEGDGYSMYIRPTAISTYPYLGVGPPHSAKLYCLLCPCGPYFPHGFKPVSLYADPENVRAWPGGVGNTKCGGNYAPTILPQATAAADYGTSQVLWLYGEDHLLTEVGSMNLFLCLKKRSGRGVELITPPLTRGDILPGVTRRSILELAREKLVGPSSSSPFGPIEVSERDVAMAELIEAGEEGRLVEAFGAGTAAIVTPIKSVVYKNRTMEMPTGDSAGALTQFFWDQLVGIQYGRIPSKWSVVVD